MEPIVGSVVTKDIPDNSVAAGIPCHVIGNSKKIEEKMEQYSKNVKGINLYDDNILDEFFWK